MQQYTIEKKWKSNFIFADSTSHISEILKDDLINHKKIYIISDSNVHKLLSPTLISTLNSFREKLIFITFSPGEKNKTRETAFLVIDELLNNHISRDDLIIGFGGGITTDISGFITSVLLRGVNYISIPTTLLGAVDASIGGKTAINTIQGKNLVGSYYFPSKTVISPQFFRSLPHEEYMNGWAEIIKIAAVSDIDLLDEISTIAKEDFISQDNSLNTLIKKSILLKNQFIKKDPFESGLRYFLNFGHTFGHAIESYSNFSIPHGKAVAMGIAIESILSHTILGLDRKEVIRLIHLLKNMGFNLIPPCSFTELKNNLHKDKKNNNNSINASLISQFGNIFNNTPELSIVSDDHLSYLETEYGKWLIL